MSCIECLRRILDVPVQHLVYAHAGLDPLVRRRSLGAEGKARPHLDYVLSTLNFAVQAIAARLALQPALLSDLALIWALCDPVAAIVSA